MLTADLQALVFPLLGAIAGGVGVYVGIRADLADLRARIVNVEKTTDRHQSRLDALHSNRGGE